MRTAPPTDRVKLRCARAGVPGRAIPRVRTRARGVSSHSSRDCRGGCWECCLERPTWSEPEELVLKGQVGLGWGRRSDRPRSAYDFVVLEFFVFLNFSLKLFKIYVYECLLACMYVRISWRPEKGVRFLGTGITNGVLGSEPRPSTRAVTTKSFFQLVLFYFGVCARVRERVRM